MHEARLATEYPHILNILANDKRKQTESRFFLLPFLAESMFTYEK